MLQYAVCGECGQGLDRTETRCPECKMELVRWEQVGANLWVGRRRGLGVGQVLVLGLAGWLLVGLAVLFVQAVFG